MRTNGGYKTRQRDTILGLLKNNTEHHLSCDEICEMLKNSGERVGATTVYRYLEKLYSEGVLQKYNDDGRAKYTYSETECRGHFHLKCTECGCILCADCDFLKGLCSHISSDHGFSVVPSKTVFYGVCKECAAKEEV